MRALIALLFVVTANSAFAGQVMRIPPAFLGEWDVSLSDCKAGHGVDHTTIEPTQILLHEAEGQVKSVKVNDARNITVTSRYNDVDGRKTSVERFALSPDGNALTWDSEGQQYRLVKCPAAAKQ